jgi:DNA-directed RNA polymerase specialized sigma subunit
MRIVGQEVNRVLAKNHVPKNLDRDELLSVAYEALTVAHNKGKKAVRLSIRSALNDRRKRELVRIRHDGEMPENVLVEFEESIIGPLVKDSTTAHQYMAIRLVYYLGMTEAEAAAEMGCSHQAVHKALTSAIGSLREKYRSIGLLNETSESTLLMKRQIRESSVPRESGEPYGTIDPGRSCAASRS